MALRQEYGDDTEPVFNSNRHHAAKRPYRSHSPQKIYMGEPRPPVTSFLDQNGQTIETSALIQSTTIQGGDIDNVFTMTAKKRIERRLKENSVGTQFDVLKDNPGSMLIGRYKSKSNKGFVIPKVTYTGKPNADLKLSEREGSVQKQNDKEFSFRLEDTEEIEKTLESQQSLENIRLKLLTGPSPVELQEF